MTRIIDGHPLEQWKLWATIEYPETPFTVLEYIDKLEQILSSPTQHIYHKHDDFKKILISMEDDHISITGLNK